MNTCARLVALTAALLSLSAIVLAALGSHAIAMNGLQNSWHTASIIHMFNAAGLLGLAALLANFKSRLLSAGTWLIVLGTLIFCGSIYLHVITGYTISSVTPLGGMVMMAGWLLAALAFVRKS